ncbi:MAG: VTT domain-containing protein [Proteobacteria bacterium]|nr:VTT domain-containing protein [Pseudomonadota bacterium]
MQLFDEYIQPLTLWLESHPHLALAITFIVALTESLAIVGSIIPGSVTMTAIGILAGSGIMRIDLTLLAATLGAIAGDGLSYLLGFFYSERLTKIWPFKRYPQWLEYGKNYFAKHGGKSVLVGRFVGPLRSIIPVIAGMMHMGHWRFFIANSLSAIGWALLYVMPGILIGAASSELSPEIATRLFIVILLFLVGIWLLSLAISWSFNRINSLFRSNLHHSWSYLLKYSKIARFLTPPAEKNHNDTAALIILFFLSLALFLILTILVDAGALIDNVNQAIHLFLQSLRTHPFDNFFVITNEIINPLVLFCIFFAVSFINIYYKDWKSLRYWLSLHFFTFLILFLVQLWVSNPRPQGIIDAENSFNSYPIIELCFAVVQFSALVLYVRTYSKKAFNLALTSFFVLILLVAGFSSLYLGDYWFSDCIGAYLCGSFICLGHWILYRRSEPKITYVPAALILVALIFLSSTILSAFMDYSRSIQSHQPNFTQYVFTEELWWNQQKPLLPIYRTNRIGKPISLFNIQYLGSLSKFEEELEKSGWHKQNDSLLNSVLGRISGETTTQELPLMSQLYLNRKPSLVMIYTPKDGKETQILRLWRSNYHLQGMNQAIWLGSVHPIILLNKKEQKKAAEKNLAKPMSYLYVNLALPQFLKREILLRLKNQRLPADVAPTLLLIKENNLNELYEPYSLH